MNHKVKKVGDEHLNRDEFKKFFLGKLNTKTKKEWLEVVKNPNFDQYMAYVESLQIDGEKIKWENIKRPYLLPFEVTDKILVYLDYFNNHNENYMRDISIIPESFLIRYKKQVPWYGIVHERNFSETLLRECMDEIGFQSILKTQNISKEFLDEIVTEMKKTEDFSVVYSKIGQCLSLNQRIDEDVLIKIIDVVKWYPLSKRRNLSMDFLRKYKHKLDWDAISFYRKNKIGELKELTEKIDWHIFSHRLDIAKECLIEFQEKLDFKIIIANETKVPIGLIEKFSKSFDEYTWQQISKYQTLSYKFIIKHIDKLCIDTVIKNQYQTMSLLTKDEREEILEINCLKKKFV